MSVEYEKITNLIKKAPSDNKTKLKDICFYGVITYLCVKPKCNIFRILFDFQINIVLI